VVENPHDELGLPFLSRHLRSIVRPMKRRPFPQANVAPAEAPAPWRPEIEPLPLRQTPYPDDRPLDFDEVKSALWHGRGNIARAAELINCPAARIGALLKKDQQLAAIRAEAAELVVDAAESVILEALEANDRARADHAAQFVLERAGRGRGWTRDGSVGIGVAVAFDGAKGMAGVSIRWQVDGE
jgi:hypothetical protein